MNSEFDNDNNDNIDVNDDNNNTDNDDKNNNDDNNFYDVGNP